MQPPVEAALIAAIGAAIGWFANHWLTSQDGSGGVGVRKSRQSLGRNYVFHDDQPLPPEELKAWLFWAESEFLPRNDQIKALLKSKAHLFDGSSFPDSYVSFFDHCNSWAVNHRRWKEQGTEYSWRSKINWPSEFENEVLATFQALKSRHAALLGTLAANSSFQRTASGGR